VANVLAKLGFDRAEVLSGVFVQELIQPSIKEETTNPPDTPMPDRQVLTVTSDWTQVFIDYIKYHKRPANKVEAEKIT
jgi:hypothetical protein